MPLSVERFVEQLADSGVLASDTIQDFLPPRRHPKDAEELARDLVRQNKLTKFQVAEISRGKGKSLVLGNYTILDRIGAGGMGQVFKAEHRRMKRIVAVKMLPVNLMKDPAVVARFEREVTAAAKLNHPNIVTAFDADNANGIHLLVMEYVEGRDLAALTKKNGPFVVEQAVDFVLQAARGLAAAHAEGIVHRDIKPGNLLLDKKGCVKILDMGLARMHGDVSKQAELTHTGTVMGTVDYMAPEQALNTKTADAPADIYSLGCTLYYLLTGKAAYDGDTLMAKLLAHRENPIPSLRASRPDVPEPVESAFRRMVAKKVEDRYQTMAAVIADLERCRPALSSRLEAAASAPDSALDTGLTSFFRDIADEPGTRMASPRRDVRGPLTPKQKRLALGIVAGTAALILLAGIVISLRTKGNAVKDGTPVVDSNKPRADRRVVNDSRKREIARAGEEGPITIPVAPGSGSTVTDTPPLRKGGPGGVNAERDAAEFVLSIGGKVVLGNVHEVKTVAELPKEPFVVTCIWLDQNQKVTDQDLLRFKDCNGLWLLGLGGTRVTDKGLSYVRDYLSAPNLAEVYIWSTSITDAGLAHLADCTGIHQIQAGNTAITDAGLRHLKRMNQMTYLWVNETRVTEAGVRQLAAALPQCLIRWDGGEIEPTKSADPK